MRRTPPAYDDERRPRADGKARASRNANQSKNTSRAKVCEFARVAAVSICLHCYAPTTKKQKKPTLAAFCPK